MKKLGSLSRWFELEVGKTKLSQIARRRLEITLGVVLAAAGAIALSSAINPSPEKIAAARAVSLAPYVVDRPALPLDRESPTERPRIDPELLEAIARGDIAAMEKLFVKGTPPNDMLTAAVSSHDVKTVRWVLAHGADPHEEEHSPHAPSLMADSDPEITKVLIEAGAAPPSLANAAAAGASNWVSVLLASGAPLDPPEASPLANALSSPSATPSQKLAIVERLLTSGANPNRFGLGSDRQPFGSIESALNGCDVTDGQDGQEDEAVARCVQLIKLLVKHNARVDGAALSTAVSTPVIYGSAHLRNLVLDAVFAARFEPGATATALVTVQSDYDSEVRGELISRMAKKGVDWGYRDGEDDPVLPLISAVRNHDRSLVTKLIAAGAPAGRRYKDGETALSALFEALDSTVNEVRIAELLISHGADVNQRFLDGRTPLFVAAEAGDLKMINLLLDRGARVNTLVLDDTALNAAEQNSQTDAARLLHARGGQRATPQWR